MQRGNAFWIPRHCQLTATFLRPILSTSSQRFRVPGSLIDASPSVRTCSRPELVPKRFHPRDFCLETIVGKVDPAAEGDFDSRDGVGSCHLP
jgi:hypothetical protein